MAPMIPTSVTVSIVSHRQMALASKLLADLDTHCRASVKEVILTLNVPEDLCIAEADYSFTLKVIRNRIPQGFGKNHNAAFEQATGDFFCVLNPDIRIERDVFTPLLVKLQEDPRLGLIAPLVVDPLGNPEDSARHFPTPMEIFQKRFGGQSRKHAWTPNEISNPDWVAGMFMLFPSAIFREIGGFNTSFFLYYEDVDLCARLMLSNRLIGFYPEVEVVHHARRESHRNLRYQSIHVYSMLRFFLSSIYREICRRKRDIRAKERSQ